MPSITDHTVLIIGGSSGMGFAAAQLSLDNGCNVHIASSSNTRVSDAVSRLRKSHSTLLSDRISGYVLDLTSTNLESDLESLFKTIASGIKSGKLDHVIYTANRLPQAMPVASVTREQIIETQTLAAVGPMLVTKVAIKYLKPSYTSSITFTGGHVDTKPGPNYTVHCASAAGLRGLTRALALDCAPIRVNMLSPGAVMTEMWGDEETRTKYAEMRKAEMLLGKVGEPEDVGEAYVYLMKNGNATGTCIESNGGSLLR